MKTLREFRWLHSLSLWSLVIAAAAQGAGAEPVPLPGRLAGRVQIDLQACTPDGVAAVRTATLQIRTGATDVDLSDLRCGAHSRATGRALVLRGDDTLGRVPPHTERLATIVFPADARHDTCRCQIGELRRIEQEQTEVGFALEAPGLGHREKPLRSFDLPLAPDALRFETVLVPEAPLRESPSADAIIIAGPAPTVRAGERIEVLALDAGWKRVRSSAGRMGWVVASTSAVVGDRALHVALALAPARPGRERDAACRAIDADDLSDLVFALLPESRTVYVHPLWYALEPGDHEAFTRWAVDCFGIAHIVDVSRNLEIRNTRWEAAPSARAR